MDKFWILEVVWINFKYILKKAGPNKWESTGFCNRVPYPTIPMINILPSKILKLPSTTVEWVLFSRGLFNKYRFSTRTANQFSTRTATLTRTHFIEHPSCGSYLELRFSLRTATKAGLHWELQIGSHWDLLKSCSSQWEPICGSHWELIL